MNDTGTTGTKMPPDAIEALKAIVRDMEEGKVTSYLLIYNTPNGPGASHFSRTSIERITFMGMMCKIQNYLCKMTDPSDMTEEVIESDG